MTIKFSSTDQSSAQQGVKVLVYGGSGAGKTRLCSTAPKPLIISAEAGLLTLRKVSIPVIEIKNVDDLREAYEWCAKSQEARQFQTLCIDTISEVAEVVLANLKRQVKDPRQAYGEVIDQVAQVIRAFRDLPGFHVYVAAKMEPIKDEMSGVIKYGPMMPGQKLGPQLPYFFDEVFRIGIGKDLKGNQFRFLQTASDLQYDAKDRSDNLSPMEWPDLSAVFAKILA